MAVLAAVDDSERSARVLKEAQRLANDIGTDVDAVHVLKRAELVSVAEREVGDQPLVENHEVQWVGRDIVARVTDESTAEAVNVTVRAGDPAEEVVAHAAETGARYIVIGGRKRSPTGKALFGSTTQSVLFDAPVPVLNVSVE